MGKELALRIAANEITAVGKQAPIFTQQNEVGKAISLADFKGKVVLVEFWASWCGPCKSFAPIFSEAAKVWEPRFRFGKINTEEQQALAAQFNIRSIPTLMIFKQGQLLAQQAGALPKPAFDQWLKRYS